MIDERCRFYYKFKMAVFPAQLITLRNGRQVALRHCGVADAPSLPDFMLRVAKETTHTLQYEGKEFSQEQIAKHWQEAEASPHSLYLGAFDGSRMVGQIHCKQSSPSHPWTRHIGYFGMMILEEFWGQGLGSRLMEEMESFARNCGVTRIEALVRTSNERGLRLYRKFGYEIEGRRRNAALINGEYQDEYPIAKLIGVDTVPLVSGQLHHVELYVSDLSRSIAFWGWFLECLGYQVYQSWSEGRSWRNGDTYIVFVQAESKHLEVPYHRKRVGLNHLAFHARSKQQVDEVTRELRAKGVTVLYGDKHPKAGGKSYAVFFEDPDRIKVELVAPHGESLG